MLWLCNVIGRAASTSALPKDDDGNTPNAKPKRRQSVLFSVSPIKLDVTENMFEVQRDLTVSESEAANVMRSSATDPSVLVGWQVCDSRST